ncbi:ATP-binding cassette domain-containing protein [Aestuariispira insulae]|uniref:ATP-binding cassette subfamily C protein LapB n=1 Tax=Aestuariispira insulae TaxID=1461337 RepID=A0A3D9HXP0_9PROT|nr:ATP-binding cassette domain-containing protein [Aestuariispira insulae]RED54175.1 ATP-binding cassette subfamily C protein LapB [Aestuariispira insulae]
MLYLLNHFRVHPLASLEMLVASLFINLLALVGPVFVIQVLNRYVAFGVDATLVTLVAGAAMALVFEFLFRQVRNRLAIAVTEPRDEETRRALMLQMAGVTNQALSAIPAGMRRQILAAGETLRLVYSPALLAGVMDLPFLILFLAGIYLLSPPLALVATTLIAAVLLLSYVGYLLLQKPTAALMKKRARMDELTDSLTNRPDTVRAFNAVGYVAGLWDSLNQEMAFLTRRITATKSRQQGLSLAAQGVMTIAIISLGATMVVQAELALGTLIGINILAARALAEANRFAAQADSLARARQARNLVAELAKLPLERQQGSTLSPFSGQIGFADMAYRHPNQASPLFEGVNLTLEPGSILILQGDNGAGKTTFLRLVAGLLPPERGRITADGMDLRQVMPEWWHRQICYMPQEPAFLDASITDNLRLHAPEADPARLSMIIDTVGLRPFIEQSPEGLATRLEQGGRNLSRGTRKRLALARALMADGPLVLFDEPDEGLDAKGREALYLVLNHLTSAGKTILIASQDEKITQAAHYHLDLNNKPTPILRATAGKKLLRPAANEASRS